MITVLFAIVFIFALFLRGKLSGDYGSKYDRDMKCSDVHTDGLERFAADEWHKFYKGTKKPTVVGYHLQCLCETRYEKSSYGLRNELFTLDSGEK